MRSLPLSAILLAVAVPAGACDGSQSSVPVLKADTAVVATAIPDAALERVRATRQLVMRATDQSLVSRGIEALSADEPRYRFATTGALVVRTSYVPARVDRTVEAMVKEATASPSHPYQAATVEMSPRSIGDGRRVPSPIKYYTATMDIRVDHFGLAGTMVDNIGGINVVGSGTGGFATSANYPIELPNVEGISLRTSVGVPAGSGPADEGIRYEMSPRDPRRAFNDITTQATALATRAPQTRLVLTTMPLTAAGNTQRNWLNQGIRAYSASSGIPLLDLAEISATGPDGSIASDKEGPRLNPAWSDPAGEKLLARRAGTAWFWLQARMAGWDGAAAVSSSSASDVAH